MQKHDHDEFLKPTKSYRESFSQSLAIFSELLRTKNLLHWIFNPPTPPYVRQFQRTIDLPYPMIAGKIHGDSKSPAAGPIVPTRIPRHSQLLETGLLRL